LARYERQLIVTSNKPFGRWGEVFGNDVVAAATIDRLVNHAEVVAPRGDSYRLKDRDLGRVPTATTNNQDRPPGVRFHPSRGGRPLLLSPGLLLRQSRQPTPRAT
jgi:hypothetical protein